MYVFGALVLCVLSCLMVGKSLIDRDLRNDLVKYLDKVSEATFQPDLDSHREAVNLYNRLKPKRNRKTNAWYDKQKQLEAKASKNWI